MIYLKNGEREMTVNMPANEEYISRYCKGLDALNNMKSKITLDKITHDDRLNELFGGREYNLEELNFFFKVYNRLDKKEKKIFHAVANAENMHELKDLINLTQNTNCYHLVDSFSDFSELGKKVIPKSARGRK